MSDSCAIAGCDVELRILAEFSPCMTRREQRVTLIVSVHILAADYDRAHCRKTSTRKQKKTNINARLLIPVVKTAISDRSFTIARTAISDRSSVIALITSYAFHRSYFLSN